MGEKSSKHSHSDGSQGDKPRKPHSKGPTPQPSPRPSPAPRPGGLYSYQELVTATESFATKNKLGSGLSGVVYKGTLPSGIVVAVKEFTSPEYAEIDFKQEMEILTKLSHPNVVRLVGYAVHEKLYIIYEYVENGSLEDWIRKIQTGQFRGKISMDWRKRIQVAIDACKGLMHMHGQTPPIYHFDYKPGNILLDRRMDPKIADFGLSRFMPELLKRSHVTLQPFGTLGYACPDFVRTGHANERTDVYSFGVVLLQLMTALPAKGNSKLKQPDLADRCVSGHSFWDARDATAGDWPEPVFAALQALARRCCNFKSRERPRLDEVLAELERALAAAAVALPLASPSAPARPHSAGPPTGQVTSPAYTAAPPQFASPGAGLGPSAAGLTPKGSGTGAAHTVGRR